MKYLAIIAAAALIIAIGADLVLKADEPRDCAYSEETKSCTWNPR